MNKLLSLFFSAWKYWDRYTFASRFTGCELFAHLQDCEIVALVFLWASRPWISSGRFVGRLHARMFDYVFFRRTTNPDFRFPWSFSRVATRIKAWNRDYKRNSNWPSRSRRDRCSFFRLLGSRQVNVRDNIPEAEKSMLVNNLHKATNNDARECVRASVC